MFANRKVRPGRGDVELWIAFVPSRLAAAVSSAGRRVTPVLVPPTDSGRAA
jgi:hypothetical protein